MRFQEFLAAKRAMAIVEHMNTLSEDDARELFESLDDDTIELIEQLLDEVTAGTRDKKLRMYNQGQIGSGEMAKVHGSYLGRKRLYTDSGPSQLEPSMVGQAAISASRADLRTAGQPETRSGTDHSKWILNTMLGNIKRSEAARAASRFPTNKK